MGVVIRPPVYDTWQVKSAMQTDAVRPSERQYSGMVDCARKLYQHEGGVARFYRGFTPCLLRSVPANGTMLLTVDLVKNMLSS